MTKHLMFRRIVILCFCLCLVATGDLFSQMNRGMKTITVQTNTGKAIELYKDSYALVIGNGTYTNGWSPLRGALQDVDEVADVLEEHGFSVTLKKDLTKRDFDEAFTDFVHNAGNGPDNRLLFYYAGHGYTQKMANGEDLGYLVMVDAPLAEQDQVNFNLEAVDMTSLITKAKLIQSRHVLFMFDSCFSGTILNLRSRPAPPQHISDRVEHPVRQFITAGRVNEQVPDHSVFKQEFLDLIQGRAGDPSKDGYITGEELGYYLSTKVPEYNNGAQHPQHGKIMDPTLNKGDFVFVLPVQTGSIFITSQPTGAQVTFSGILQERRTPVRIQDVMAGTHMLKLTLKDYEDYTQQIVVEAGKEMTVNPTLRVSRKGRSRWPFIIGGVVVAVAAYLIIDGPRPPPPPGDLEISISIP